MIDGLFLGLSALLLFPALLIVKKRSASRKRERHESLSRLEEVIRSSELTNNTFFRSLELVQNNLENLLARAENTEQRLRTLILQPGGERRDHYQAAAMLLAEGLDPTRIAAMLNLPLGQIHLVQELRKIPAKDKQPPRGKNGGDVALRPNVFETKIAASPEKAAARPILLTDVVEEAPETARARLSAARRWSGVTA
jgi:hypothetical protein